jgi:hypothetical protein
VKVMQDGVVENYTAAMSRPYLDGHGGRTADSGLSFVDPRLLAEAMTDMTLPFIDGELAGRQYPFGSLARAGARLAAGSDWPVSTPDPIAGLHVAVNRVAHGEDTDPLLPHEALTLEQAFAAYTSGSAHVNHLDDTGRLAPGMLADLTVLDRDPFAGEPEAIGSTTVVAT